MALKLTGNIIEKSELAKDIVSLLGYKYGGVDLGNKSDPLDELIFILLTVRTNYRLYEILWRNFKNRYNKWEQVIVADEEEIADTIILGGMQKQKANRILDVLTYLYKTTGKLSLDFLHELSDEDSEKFLRTIPGVGRKIARCVMLFALHKETLPVDSNILRVSRRIGLIGLDKNEGKNADLIQIIIPRENRHKFHVYAVSLGREICIINSPKCNLCPLIDLCNYGRGLNK